MAQWLDIVLPAGDEQVAEAVVGQWLKKEGDPVALHEPLLEVNTDKVVVEVPAPAAGVLREIRKREGDSVHPSDVLGRIDPQGAATAPTAPPRPESAADPGPRAAAPAPDSETRLSPAVRRALKEHGLDASQLRGTGRGGRITHEDVARFLKERPRPAAPPRDVPAPGAARLTPHSPMRRRIAAHMVESVRTAPHVTAVFEADFSRVARHRRQNQDEFLRRGAPLTYTAYLVAAAARALQETPEVNSRWRDDGLELLPGCHIGVATALGRGGLVVPVIHDAQALSLFGIASRLRELTELARAGKLTSAHLEGGTFTLTNHGVSGSLIATPIIHQPQSAILGVGKIQKRVMVRDHEDGEESLRVAPMAYVTLTIDHRALDGFVANEFLTHFVQALESWP